MECPICTEILSPVDILVCGHCVHKECIKKSADAMQSVLVSEGYPPRTCGRCPLCRRDQPDIQIELPVWIGSIELTKETMQSLLNILRDNDGWISESNIPMEIVDQMPHTSSKDKLLTTNCAATQLWVRESLPQRMRLTRRVEGVFRCRYSP